ncbi:cadherin domain-containing protein, partial [Vreelandella titanicae]|uniref:cadherin domain-containing protein n=2 Tax=Vreelandella titanicae TaxID=664683 RepID=UPI0015945BD4|nr:cadherin repeat domain-containing protein [Halomonas titanicae]
MAVNDIAPAITTGQSFSVNESDTNSTSLGTVATTGDDNSVSYSIKSGNTGNAFTIDGATGEITLSDTSQLDASATGSYTLSVQATDGNTASTQDVTINVTDDVAPSVTSIAPSGSPDANAASVDYTVTFSESVSNVSADDFTLTSTGTASGTISAVAGSGDSYTVSVTGISGEGDLRLDLNSGTDIDDGATNAPAGYTSGTAHSVDLVKPSVTNVTSPTADGTYKAGDTVDITLTFSEVVTVTGTPQLTLETGATDRVIDYTAGSGTNTLTFAYTVQAGDETSDLALAGSEILLNGGTLQDAEGNDAVVTLPTPGDANSLSANKDIVIDAVAPSVTSIAPSGSPAANASSVDYTVTFSEDVDDVSIDDFLLNTTGSASGNIASISGSGSSYTVTVDTITGEGDLRLDLNDGTDINDGAGNASEGFSSGTAHTVDVMNPSVTNVTSTNANGTYKAGDTVNITLAFSEAVTVSGTPQLTLETGATDRTIDYVAGS